LERLNRNLKNSLLNNIKSLSSCDTTILRKRMAAPPPPDAVNATNVSSPNHTYYLSYHTTWMTTLVDNGFISTMFLCNYWWFPFNLRLYLVISTTFMLPSDLIYRILPLRMMAVISLHNPYTLTNFYPLPWSHQIWLISYVATYLKCTFWQYCYLVTVHQH
jgi:hypothetical protein